MTEPGAIGVGRAVELGVPRSWQEAVAVAQEAAHAMASAGGATTALDITTGGRVVLTGTDQSVEPTHVVRALLSSLLEGCPAPEELTALASRDEHTSLEALQAALAYFERAGRQGDVAALARRALSLEAEAQASHELARLRSGASTAVPPAVVSTAARRRPVPPWSVIAAGLIVGLAVAAWYVGARPGAAGNGDDGTSVDALSARAVSGLGSMVSAASEALSSATDVGLRSLGLAADDTGAPPASAAAPAPTVAASPAAGRDAGSPLPAGPPPAPMPMAGSVDSLPVVLADPEEAALAEPASGPYTAADTDVTPPMLLYPQLPSEPSTSAQPDPDTPHFELLVNEHGIVEQVRLRAEELRLQDRMLVSAAKAWRFRPAWKDGRPVPYRVRVPVPR